MYCCDLLYFIWCLLVTYLFSCCYCVVGFVCGVVLLVVAFICDFGCLLLFI